MNEADVKRVEEIKRRFTADDVRWLITHLETAQGEIERLTQELGIANSGNEVLRDLRSEKL